MTPQCNNLNGMGHMGSTINLNDRNRALNMEFISKVPGGIPAINTDTPMRIPGTLVQLPLCIVKGLPGTDPIVPVVPSCDPPVDHFQQIQTILHCADTDDGDNHERETGLHLMSSVIVSSSILPIPLISSSALGEHSPYIDYTVGPVSQPYEYFPLTPTTPLMHSPHHPTVPFAQIHNSMNTPNDNAQSKIEARLIRLSRHNEVEIRRRQRITFLFNELTNELGCLQKDKATILSAAIQWIKVGKKIISDRNDIKTSKCKS